MNKLSFDFQVLINSVKEIVKFTRCKISFSYFGRVELPTLGALKRVERLIVLVVFDLDTNPK